MGKKGQNPFLKESAIMVEMRIMKKDMGIYAHIWLGRGERLRNFPVGVKGHM